MSSHTTREALEESLIENFSDPTLHAVYADLLMEEGDPRGEYIQLRLSLEQAGRLVPEMEAMRQRSAELFARHEEEWIGPRLTPWLNERRRDIQAPMNAACQHTFTRGWLIDLEADSITRGFIEDLAASPEIRLLHRLILRNTSQPGDPSVLEPLSLCPWLRALRILEIGGETFGGINGSHVAGIVQRTPAIRQLRISVPHCDTMRLFSLPMPDLEVLMLDRSWIPSLLPLAENQSLKNIRQFSLMQPSTERALMPYNPGGEFELELEVSEDPFGLPPRTREVPPPSEQMPREHLRKFFQAKQFRNLSRLRIRHAGFGDIGCAELVESGIMSQLQSLDLPDCNITDAGVDILLRSPDIQVLGSLERNPISETAMHRFRNSRRPARWTATSFPEDELMYFDRQE